MCPIFSLIVHFFLIHSLYNRDKLKWPTAKAGILASGECLFKAHNLCSQLLNGKPKEKLLQGKN